MIDAVVERLAEARSLAAEAIQRRQALGDPDAGDSPPGRADRVLATTQTRIADGEIGPWTHTLGLSRGAADFVWPPEEQPIVDLIYEIDDYWRSRVWDPQTYPVRQPPNFTVRHVHRPSR